MPYNFRIDVSMTANIDAEVAKSIIIAAVEREARKMDREQIILANLCGRGDKDIFTVAEALGTSI